MILFWSWSIIAVLRKQRGSIQPCSHQYRLAPRQIIAARTCSCVDFGACSLYPGLSSASYAIAQFVSSLLSNNFLHLAQRFLKELQWIYLERTPYLCYFHLLLQKLETYPQEMQEFDHRSSLSHSVCLRCHHFWLRPEAHFIQAFIYLLGFTIIISEFPFIIAYEKLEHDGYEQLLLYRLQLFLNLYDFIFRYHD